MTAITPDLVQIFNKPSTVKHGSSEKRLVEIYVEAKSATAASTLNLATYVPGLQGVVALEERSNNVIPGTANTFTGTTVTYAGHVGTAEVWRQLILGHYQVV